MRRHKHLSIILALSLALSAIFAFPFSNVVYAEEIESVMDEVLTDDLAESLIVETADKGLYPDAIEITGNPFVSTFSVDSNNSLNDNTDANNSAIVGVNSMQYDFITEDGEQRWYVFYTEEGKVTLDLSTPDSENVDYDLYLWQYSENELEEGEINLIAGSENEDTSNEHLALFVDEGVYFVLVNGYSGYDDVFPFNLWIGYSDEYDSAEIDDSISQASVVSVPFNISGTIDNAFDYDFIKFTLNQSGMFNLSLTNDGSAVNIYRVDIFNGAGTALGYLPQGESGSINLSAGNYYLRICASTYGNDNVNGYIIDGRFSRIASRVNVTSAGNAFINYGYGQYWRIDSSTTVSGTAYDASGNILPNANIQIVVPVVVGNDIKIATGTTDSQGRFSIYLNLGPAAGQYMYDTGVSYHYYDIVPIYFFSGGNQINSNISYIYHFAYSIYHSF